MPARNQQDFVNNYKADQGDTPRSITDRLQWPGIDHLHMKSREEIAETLVNVLKSRANITNVNWELGKSYIEITYHSG